jgi:hypothetical protein
MEKEEEACMILAQFLVLAQTWVMRRLQGPEVVLEEGRGGGGVGGERDFLSETRTCKTTKTIAFQICLATDSEEGKEGTMKRRKRQIRGIRRMRRTAREWTMAWLKCTVEGKEGPKRK